jgi:hypothetical protein
MVPSVRLRTNPNWSAPAVVEVVGRGSVGRGSVGRGSVVVVVSLCAQAERAKAATIEIEKTALRRASMVLFFLLVRAGRSRFAHKTLQPEKQFPTSDHYDQAPGDGHVADGRVAPSPNQRIANPENPSRPVSA